MALLTLFSAPKPFSDPHIAVIQRNALQSWLRLPDTEVVLVGSETGLAEVAAEFNVPLLPQVTRNESGTPLVSSIFALANQASTSPLLAYVNGDMLFTSDFVEGARAVAAAAEHFLIVGQRWDLDITRPLDFSNGWEQRLHTSTQSSGRLHPPQGSDYFIFPRGQFMDMPPFAIGRAGWDNWMIYYACQHGWPVIDATTSILAMHQNHDYSHLPGGQPHYDLEESHQNTILAGGTAHLYNMLDTNAVLANGTIQRPPFTLARLVRRAELRLMPPQDQRHGPRWWTVRRLRKLRRRLTRGELEG
jgi:hypothetical protein